jgi:uncharacterized ion transporter superfamily protein YfcC
MNQPSSLQINKRAFSQALIILFVLMLVAGTLTRLVPSGEYARVEQEGRQVIDPTSYQPIPHPDYPIWRWFTAPLEVLWGPDSLTIVTILIFLLMIGSAFAVLDRGGLLQASLSRIVSAFGGRKYLLLAIVVFFFMCLGAFLGIIEEVIPLVPLMMALAYYLGWDALVGLGMSVLAANMGFSVAITNPFTIGVAQNLAGLPLFSGAWLRFPIFLVVYVVFSIFLVRYARKIEHNPRASLIYTEDQSERARYASFDPASLKQESGPKRLRRASLWLLAFLAAILLVLILGPFVPALSALTFPLVGLLFFFGGLGAGFLAGMSSHQVWKTAWDGLVSIAPSIPLILMAASIKYIVAQGAILDTLLYRASSAFASASPFTAVLLIYILALLLEFFISSGSAKAFLLMPVLLPLADLVGVTRQITITAYCFGDGFTNMAYPTNAMLLICLGLTSISYPKWLRWTLPLWGMILLITILFLAFAIAIHFGPF